MDEKTKLYTANTTNLAYMGDTVYELFVRERLVREMGGNTKALHKEAVRYVSAAGQAVAMKAMMEELSDEEQALVKRARNKDSATKPKNADPVEYKWATALEALVGYYYLLGEKDRAEELTKRAMAVIDGAAKER